MKRKIKVLIADDHELVRTGLGSLIDLEDDMKCVGMVKNGALAVELAAKLSPDVVVMDLVMPVLGGIAATSKVVAECPAAKVLILTTYGSADELRQAMDNGASGAILKTAPNGEILEAIRKLAAGTSIAFPAEEADPSGEPDIPRLTLRQREILKSLSRGLSNDDIALQLGISHSRVKKHVSNILRKLGAATRAEAVARAMQKRLL